jgi:adenine phosphoribosyltransferase
MNELGKKIEGLIRNVPDFPKPGIQFKDITPVLQDAGAFKEVISAMASALKGENVRYVAGIESRGFIFASALALELGCGLVLMRKPGKLPRKSFRATYQLEYGTDAIEMHEDACKKGDRVVIFDDLIATGGTMLAAASIVKRLGGEVVEAAAIIDLPDLGGSQKIWKTGVPVHTLSKYEGH